MVWTILFFPLYTFVNSVLSFFEKKNLRPVLSEAISKFREAGITPGEREKDAKLLEKALYSDLHTRYRWKI